MPLVHKLEFPLVLTGAGSTAHHYLLPHGTTLYYDQAFPEGFVRYKVYVNVEGVKLESHKATEKFWLDPLTAFPVDAEQLRKLLRDYPLTKDDLAAILKSSKISKTEIRSLLEEFSRGPCASLPRAPAQEWTSSHVGHRHRHRRRRWRRGRSHRAMARHPTRPCAIAAPCLQSAKHHAAANARVQATRRRCLSKRWPAPRSGSSHQQPRGVS